MRVESKFSLVWLICVEQGPTLVRLSWHSSGTYDKMSKTGGSGKGTMRFKEELEHGANAGLDKAVAKLEPFKAKYPDVSYADLYTLAGVASIEALGGPVIKWSSPLPRPLPSHTNRGSRQLLHAPSVPSCLRYAGSATARCMRGLKLHLIEQAPWPS